ncbi:MAG: hypothetical protein WCS94_22690, partial [Verrucomicrobiota bacterium]
GFSTQKILATELDLIQTVSEDEKTKWAGKLQDKQIVIGVRELNPFGGRLRARGAIVTGPDGK